ncbi:hypothetical protein ACYPKM_02235 [Pseudomonas aeruginosa]
MPRAKLTQNDQLLKAIEIVGSRDFSIEGECGQVEMTGELAKTVIISWFENAEFRRDHGLDGAPIKLSRNGHLEIWCNGIYFEGTGVRTLMCDVFDLIKAKPAKVVKPVDPAVAVLRKARRQVMTALRKKFTPHMWNSGYRTGGRNILEGERRPLKLWSPRDKQGNFIDIEMKGLVLTDFGGFSEEGVIVDSSGGGLVTQPLSAFPLEDLLMLSKWADKNLPKAA